MRGILLHDSIKTLLFAKWKRRPSTGLSSHCVVVAVTNFCEAGGRWARRAFRRSRSSSPKMSSSNNSGAAPVSTAKTRACASFRASATVRC